MGSCADIILGLQQFRFGEGALVRMADSLMTKYPEFPMEQNKGGSQEYPYKWAEIQAAMGLEPAWA